MVNTKKPYFSTEYLPLPPLRLRLALVCAQMIVYYQSFEFLPKQLLLFKKCFDKYSQEFHSNYRRKVNKEFAAAIIETEKFKINPIECSIVSDSGSSSGIDTNRSSKKRKLSALNTGFQGVTTNISAKDCADTNKTDTSMDRMNAILNNEEDDDAMDAALDSILDLDRAKRQLRSNSNS